MARIDYTGILLATKDILEADSNIQQMRATVELMRTTIPIDISPHINIYEGRRDPSQQMLDMGTSQWYFFKWQLMVSAFSAAGFEDAGRQRDELLGYVELAMMKSRNLGGFLANKPLLLMGGDLHSMKVDNGLWATGTLDLRIELKATTT
jgi:hypothetical protein